MFPRLGVKAINGFEKCRRRAGLTQVEAAIAIGVTQGTISQWEGGEVYPVGSRVQLIAEVYGSTIDELFEREEKTE